jgi:hypothetical protein
MTNTLSAASSLLLPEELESEDLSHVSGSLADMFTSSLNSLCGD